MIQRPCSVHSADSPLTMPHVPIVEQKWKLMPTFVKHAIITLRRTSAPIAELIFPAMRHIAQNVAVPVADWYAPLAIRLMTLLSVSSVERL